MMKSCYTHEVRFTKTFTGGVLKGLTIEDRLGFCDASSARKFIADCLRRPEVRRPCVGSPYRVTAPYLYALED
jgi:hypothetical protein